MKILIVGATGATGKLLVNQLLENGHEVKAFACNEKKFSNETMDVLKNFSPLSFAFF